MSLFGTKIGADGRRYPAGDEPTDYDDYRPVVVRSDDDITAIAQVATTSFGRSLLALPDADALGTLTGGGGGLPAISSGDGTSTIEATGAGAVVFGQALADGTGTATVEATGESCFAGGKARSNDPGASAIIRASTKGAVALGDAYAWGTSQSLIESTNHGTFAFGCAYMAGVNDATIRSSMRGAFAGGYAYADGGDATIEATAEGSFAFGAVYGSGDIAATAINAVQFGIGTNALADSLAVGVGPRFKGTVGAPAAPRNGDIWVDGSGNLMCRTAGVTKSLTAI